MMIDGISQRYGMTPTQALDRCNTFDVFIMDSAMSFEQYHHQKQMNNGQEPIPEYSTDELMAIIERGRSKKFQQ